MKFIFLRIRNFLDFMWFGIKVGNIDIFALIVDLGILIYTFTDFDSLFATNNLLILFFLIFINVIWQIYSTVKASHDYYRRLNCFSTSVGVSKDYKFDNQLSGHYYILTIKEIGMAVLISPDINDILRKSKINCRYTSSKRKRVNKYIRTHKDTLLKFLNYKWHSMADKGGAFYNESKLCMASELYENRRPDGSYMLALCKGNYYNSYLTNNIYSICLNESGFIIEAPRNVRNYQIKQFSDSEFGDHIGVSTIIISSDGYAFIMRHNNKTALFTNELLPSASGSADYSDYNKADDFKTVIIKAIERELEEETRIKKNVINETIVTGFYRCLHRGGKPEFCCLTYLNIDRIDVQEIIIPDNKEQSEEIHPVKLSANDRNDFITISDFIKANIAECSLPLYMTYYMMLNYYGKEADIGYRCSIGKQITSL